MAAVEAVVVVAAAAALAVERGRGGDGGGGERGGSGGTATTEEQATERLCWLTMTFYFIALSASSDITATYRCNPMFIKVIHNVPLLLICILIVQQRVFTKGTSLIFLSAGWFNSPT